MKYRILTLMLSGIVLFTSCEGDDELQEIEILGVETSIAPTITLDNGNFGVEGETLDYTVTLPTSFSSDATLTLSVDFRDLTNSFSDVSVVVPAGSTQVSGSIDLNSIQGTNPFSGIPTSIRVKGIILNETDGNNYVIDGDGLTFPLYEEFANPSNDITVAIDWNESPSTADLDIALWTEFGAYAGSVSQTGSRFEEVTFGSNLPDGTYDLRFRNFAQESAVLPLNIFIKNFDGSVELATRSIDNPMTFPTAWFPMDNDNILVTVVKTTDVTDPDAPVVSYSVTTM